MFSHLNPIPKTLYDAAIIKKLNPTSVEASLDFIQTQKNAFVLYILYPNPLEEDATICVTCRSVTNGAATFLDELRTKCFNLGFINQEDPNHGNIFDPLELDKLCLSGVDRLILAKYIWDINSVSLSGQLGAIERMSCILMLTLTIHQNFVKTLSQMDTIPNLVVFEFTEYQTGEYVFHIPQTKEEEGL